MKWQTPKALNVYVSRYYRREEGVGVKVEGKINLLLRSHPLGWFQYLPLPPSHVQAQGYSAHDTQQRSCRAMLLTQSQQCPKAEDGQIGAQSLICADLAQAIETNSPNPITAHHSRWCPKPNKPPTAQGQKQQVSHNTPNPSQDPFLHPESPTIQPQHWIHCPPQQQGSTTHSPLPFPCHISTPQH